MEGRVKIWIIGHRPTTEPYWENELYQPLQVGEGKDFLTLRDNQGDNIASWNKVYCEMTGVYEVAKNLELPDYVGICQYRRRLQFKDSEEVEKIFESFDAIAAKPLKMGMTPFEQYAKCHNRGDIELAGRIIKDKYPEYAKGFDRHIMNGNTLFYSNGFVLRTKDFLDYCNFFFGFASKFCKRKGWDTPDKAVADIEGEMIRGERRKSRGLGYQSLVLGFLSERMLTLFLLTRFGEKRIKKVDYLKLEGV